MTLAIITTTINMPSVLQLYRAFYPQAAIYVTGDEKTPHDHVRTLCNRINAAYLDPEDQRARKWECCDALGWNTPLRRNIAILEALRAGHEYIWTIDDDNIPFTPRDEFYDYTAKFQWPYHGFQVSTPTGWFNPNELLYPRTTQRGFPRLAPLANAPWEVHPVTHHTIGVMSGLILGSPDVDAIERIANHPMRQCVSELARNGVITNPAITRTVFNSQNTLFVSVLAPAMFMVPRHRCYDRYDDIYASAICQRIMQQRNWCVHLGQPFAYQERNHHDNVRDLALEMDGMRKFWTFSGELQNLELPENETVVNQLRAIYDQGESIQLAEIHPQHTELKEIGGTGLFPELSKSIGHAWLNDCEKALAERPANMPGVYRDAATQKRSFTQA